MKKYIDESKRDIKEAYCNKCGKELLVENGMIKEGVFSVEEHWGYFSTRDGQVDEFDLCEECYEKMIKEFILEVATTEEIEFV